jgi:C-terminal processing protease CtpA/Prc
VAPYVAKIGCGHSVVWMPESYWENIEHGLFPLELHFLKGAVCVSCPYREEFPIPEGTEIISINDMPITEIAEKLKNDISADGFNDGYKRFRLKKRFSFLFAIHFGFQDKFKVVYKMTKSNRSETIVLKSVGASPILNHTRCLKEMCLNFDDDIATLRINSFYYRKFIPFQQFIDSAFSEIEASGVNSLILDLRGNDGGSPKCSVLLLSYLLESSVPYFKKTSIAFLGLKNPIQLKKNRFKGDLYVLTDGACFSSTGHMCAILHYYKRGIFIGEETGGNFTCNNASEVFKLRNTGIRIRMANRSFSVAVENMDINTGIIPNVRIELRSSDISAHHDPVLQHAIGLCLQNL